ncbi:TrmH family RNA methyltransferase [Allorhizocola rhizosphaerae]|uniref:TrmH family RNA methyltransferase n=1 Tax=Allorhizocola rhizosphaerae TaxID=1872709 RepID=UPI001B8C064A|nr:TrmH family RNA methyltransferase [Allorhizocola rhizosphaerae]
MVDWRQLIGQSEFLLLDGFHALKHAIRFGAEVPLAITDDKPGALRLASQLAPDIIPFLDKQLAELASDVFKELLPRAHPTRVASVARRPGYRALRAQLYTESRGAPIVLLDNPRNLGNVGAVVRIAAGFAAAGVVTVGEVDPWHTNVLRGSAGLHFATAVLSAAADDLPPGPVYALDPGGTDIRSLAIPDDALLAFGSERHGISDIIRSRATQLVAIPMRPKVSSYNLATSVAMTLFWWSCQEVLGD